MPKKLQGDDIAPRMTVGFRTSPELRRRLEEDAKRSGRALALEAELRIERSYAAEDLAPDAETQRLLFGFARALQGLAIAEGSLPWHQNPSLTWDRVSERLGQVYTFDHELSLPLTAEEIEAADRPLPTEGEEAAAMKIAGKRWATPDELKTFQWTEPMSNDAPPAPAQPASTKRSRKPKS